MWFLNLITVKLGATNLKPTGFDKLFLL